MVLRLHARYASRTELVNDYRLSALAAACVFHRRNDSLTAAMLPTTPTTPPTLAARSALLAVILQSHG